MAKKFGLDLFEALLRMYPREFRDEYGREMALVLADRYRCATNGLQRAFILMEAFAGVLTHAPKEHFFVIARDLRYALRSLRKSPVFAVTAIVSLALGIGANTAIFAVAKEVLFDALPVKESGQLRLLTWVSGRVMPVPPVWGDVGGNEEGGLTSTAFSYPVLQELRKTTVFQDLIAFKDVEMTATVDGHPEFLAGEMLSGNALAALGVSTMLGRSFTMADDAGPETSPVAMISRSYWAERFGRSADVLGKTISLNGAPVTIVGVVAGDFTGLTMGTASKVFVPLTLQPLLMPRAQKIGSGATSLLENPRSWWVQAMMRLRDNVPEARAQATLDTVLRRTVSATLPEAKGLEQFHLKLQSGDRGIDYLGGYAKTSYVLMGLSGLVLALACVNLVNLLLARATARQREFSTRLALGAGRVGLCDSS